MIDDLEPGTTYAYACFGPGLEDRGLIGRFRTATASDMLSQLAAEDSTTALERRLRRLCRPKILCIDELATCRTEPAPPTCCSR
jgi:hypothetical protein